MIFADEFQLKDPFGNGFAEKNDPVVIHYMAQHEALRDKLVNGTLYIKFIDGDRKGAIAKIKPNTKAFGDYACRPVEIDRRYNSWNQAQPYFFQHDRFAVIASWDKRKNSVQLHLPSREVVFLPNYEGPTVWELFDKNSAKEEALKNPGQNDIDGKLLAIGDEVLYINARYGCGMELEHGTITEFKVVVDSKKVEISTIVSNADGVLSNISNSKKMIFKKLQAYKGY